MWENWQFQEAPHCAGGASSSQVTVSEFTASGIDEVDELSSLPHLKPGELHRPSAPISTGKHAAKSFLQEAAIAVRPLHA